MLGRKREDGGGSSDRMRREEHKRVEEDGGPYCCCELVGSFISCCLSCEEWVRTNDPDASLSDNGGACRRSQ